MCEETFPTVPPVNEESDDSLPEPLLPIIHHSSPIAFSQCEMPPKAFKFNSNFGSDVDALRCGGVPAATKAFAAVESAPADGFKKPSELGDASAVSEAPRVESRAHCINV